MSSAGLRGRKPNAKADAKPNGNGKNGHSNGHSNGKANGHNGAAASSEGPSVGRVVLKRCAQAVAVLLVAVAVLVFALLLWLYVTALQPSVSGSERPYEPVYVRNFVYRDSGMTFALFAWGSRGDIQPMVVLGRELRERGHNVVVAALPRFASLITAHGLTHHHMPPDGVDEFAAALSAMPPPPELIGIFAGYTLNRTQGYWHTYHDVLKRYDVDVMVAGALPWTYAAPRDLSELYGKPVVLLEHDPLLLPTRFHAGDIPGEVIRRSWFSPINLLFMRLLPLVAGVVTHSAMNDGRAALGLPPRTGSASYDFSNPAHLRQYVAIVSYSRHLLPTPSDWPQWYHHVGPLLLSSERDEPVPDDLKAFLARGRGDTLYVGFGSWGGAWLHVNATALTQELYRALDALGVRAVVLSRTVDIIGAPVPPHLKDRVYVADTFAHSYVLPRCDIIFHHGGAGTTMVSARAGKPVVIVPSFALPKVWANLFSSGPGAGGLDDPDVADTGVHLPLDDWSAARVVTAVRHLNTTAIRQRAALLGERIRAEGGVAEGVTRMMASLKSAAPAVKPAAAKSPASAASE